MPLHNSIKFEAVFHSYTNSSYSKMFVDHNLNSRTVSVAMPSEIEVPAILINKIKTLKKGDVISISVKRKTTFVGLAAVLEEIQ